MAGMKSTIAVPMGQITRNVTPFRMPTRRTAAPLVRASASPGREQPVDNRTPANDPPAISTPPGYRVRGEELKKGLEEVPCPFLRCLVKLGALNPHEGQISRTASLIGAAAGKSGVSHAAIVGAAALIALGSNGVRNVARNGITNSFQPDHLREGPLYKSPDHSGILTDQGEVDDTQLERLASFAKPYPNPDGGTELGLGLPELKTMMDENAKRSGKWFLGMVHRKLMNGEWPILLQVMGKGQGDQRYLSIAELGPMYHEGKLPARIENPIAGYVLPDAPG